MIYSVYCVRDSLTGFLTPSFDLNDASAMRNFKMACEAVQPSVMSFNPSDFCLYHIADFDTVSGHISPLNPIELVCSGKSMIVEGEKK